MSEPLQAAPVTLQILEGTSPSATFPLSGPVEIGRRDKGEPPPYVVLPASGASLPRILIADWHEKSISRKHLIIEPQPDGKLLLTNQSSQNSIALAGGRRIAPLEKRLLDLPVTCELGGKVLRFEGGEPPEPALQSLLQPSLVPRSAGLSSLAALRPFNELGSGTLVGGLKDIDLLAWLQASLEIFQSAAGSADFLPKAVQAAAQLVNLETVAVLLRHKNAWETAALSRGNSETTVESWRASQTTLARVLEERRTFFFAPPRSTAAASLVGVRAVVAAPILDATGNVIGALYGEGRGPGRAALGPVKELEAKLFELIAYGVAAGLARAEQERKLIAERVKFEQFFTPELARLLETRGDEMLAPREADVTVLFCDIRGFSRIASRCPAADAIEWVRETLSLVSDCVAEHRGTLIDYGGDSLEALWGAPQDNSDHALDACLAALAMQAAIPELSRRWEPRLGEPTAISIGIHTGPAQVGNIGSRRKFKYGAFGTTVNLASRVQGTTKHAGVYLIISGATALRVTPQLCLRRLCQVRTVNISQPVDLYELVPAGDEIFLRLRTEYEAALTLFEQAQFPAAHAALEQLLVSFPHDPPAAKLLARVKELLGHPPERFDGIWDLDSK